MKDLSADQREIVKLKCRQKLDGIYTEDDLQEVIKLAKEFSLDEIEAEAYKILGDLHCSKHDFKEAFGYYKNSLEIYKSLGKNKIICYLYNRLGVCKSKELDHLDALSYFTRAYYYAEMYKDEKTKKSAAYNIARCYKKLEKYDSAIEYIDEYISNLDSNDSFEGYAYACILKANCLEAKGEIDKAISLSLDLIKECKLMDHPILGFVYNNLGIIYMEKGDYDFSEQFLNEAERVRLESDIYDLAFTYIDKARLYLNQGNINLALEYADKGLQYEKEYCSEETLLHAYLVLVDIYSTKKDYKNLKDVYEKIFQINKDKHQDEEMKKIYVNAALFHLDMNDVERSKKYLSKILE